MIKFMQADDNSTVTNINISSDPASPDVRVINWMPKNADGYILLFSDVADNTVVDSYFGNINMSETDPKALVLNKKYTKVRVLSRKEFLSAGGKFVYNEPLLIPMRITIQTYRIIGDDIVIYRTEPGKGSDIIPIIVTCTVTVKKSMMFMGERMATVKFSTQDCEEGALFYQITGDSMKYPITKEMMRSSFTVNVGHNEIGVFADGEYAKYYMIKQTRV